MTRKQEQINSRKNAFKVFLGQKLRNRSEYRKFIDMNE